MAIKIGQIISRYSIVTLLPAFVLGSIYVDHTYTKDWKRKRIEQQKQEQAYL